MYCRQCSIKCCAKVILCCNCKEVYYCSELCLIEAWPAHKKACRSVHSNKEEGMKRMDKVYADFIHDKDERKYRKNLGVVYETMPESCPRILLSCRHCRRCKVKFTKSPLGCKNCKSARYCDANCLYNDWRHHRTYCFNSDTRKYATEDTNATCIDYEYLSFQETKLIKKIRRKKSRVFRK